MKLNWPKYHLEPRHCHLAGPNFSGARIFKAQTSVIKRPQIHQHISQTRLDGDGHDVQLLSNRRYVPAFCKEILSGSLWVRLADFSVSSMTAQRPICNPNQPTDSMQM